jgi:hypothetical protein
MRQAGGGKGVVVSAKILNFVQSSPFPHTGGSDAGETRRAIIWAAIEALEAGGRAGCSIEEIALRVGTEASEVIRLFGDVTEVLAGAVRELAAWANVSPGYALPGQGAAGNCDFGPRPSEG